MAFRLGFSGRLSKPPYAALGGNSQGGMGIDGMSWKELDKFVEPKFHKSSYGYRKGRSQHQGGSEANDHLRNKSEINKQCIGKVQVDEYP